MLLGVPQRTPTPCRLKQERKMSTNVNNLIKGDTNWQSSNKSDFTGHNIKLAKFSNSSNILLVEKQRFLLPVNNNGPGFHHLLVEVAAISMELPWSFLKASPFELRDFLCIKPTTLRWCGPWTKRHDRISLPYQNQSSLPWQFRQDFSSVLWKNINWKRSWRKCPNTRPHRHSLSLSYIYIYIFHIVLPIYIYIYIKNIHSATAYLVVSCFLLETSR